jgi:hypothetical protein
LSVAGLEAMCTSRPREVSVGRRWAGGVCNAASTGKCGEVPPAGLAEVVNEDEEIAPGQHTDGVLRALAPRYAR